MKNKYMLDKNKKFYIYDMHSHEKIDMQYTMDEAIIKIWNDIAANANTKFGRCYEIYDRPFDDDNKKLIWFGDSWKVQYYLENSNLEIKLKMNVEEYNKSTIFPFTYKK